MQNQLKLPIGRGRVQFLACKDEIFDLIEKGYSVANIHKFLIDNKRITISYATLVRLVRGKIINVPAHGHEHCIYDRENLI